MSLIKKYKAKERVYKQKQGRVVVPLAMGLSKYHKFSIITYKIDNDEEMPPPFIAIKLSNEGIQTYAFIDSRLDVNTISYELFQQLKNVEH